ncbi:MAG: TlpA family protein disulfide reductase, partial [Lewinella sp.]
MPRFALLLLLWLLSPSIFAQITLKVGDEAPKITPTEYLFNGVSKSKLKDKSLVLTLCKSWDLPCLDCLTQLDSLRTAFPNDQVVFLNLFRGNTELARKDTENSNFKNPLATDLSGATQIRYGDGEAGLVSWPLTILIDDQNVVRWQGYGGHLTVEALVRFIQGQYPVIDLTSKYVPLDPESFLFEPMTADDIAKLWEEDSVASFVRGWDQDDFAEDFYNSLYSTNHEFCAYGPETLENIFQELFPEKRLELPGDLMEKKYRVAYVQRLIDRNTVDHLIFNILEEIGLKATVTSKPATYYKLEVTSRLKLDLPREVSIINKLPDGMKDLGSYSAKNLHNFEVRKYDLAGLAKLLNKYSPDRWKYEGRNRKKYNFILDVSSTKA